MTTTRIQVDDGTLKDNGLETPYRINVCLRCQKSDIWTSVLCPGCGRRVFEDRRTSDFTCELCETTRMNDDV